MSAKQLQKMFDCYNERRMEICIKMAWIVSDLYTRGKLSYRSMKPVPELNFFDECTITLDDGSTGPLTEYVAHGIVLALIANCNIDGGQEKHLDLTKRFLFKVNEDPDLWKDFNNLIEKIYCYAGMTVKVFSGGSIEVKLGDNGIEVSDA